MNKQYKICVIGGDGIGPDVINEGVRLLNHLKINFDFTEAEAGFVAYQKHGSPLPDETLKKCRQADAILFGAVTTPPNIESYQSPIIQMRKKLKLFANIRPCISFLNDGKKINFIIIRENTEGVYAGNERLIKGGAVTERIITRKACQRIIRFAFEMAKREKRSLVTAVHKANVMRLTDGLFLSVAQEIAQEYPDINFEDMLVDSTAMRLIKEPEHFDIIVTTNMFGDILSDESSMLIGGLGVAASANIGEKYALFEPIHGSAPKYAGQNKANPLASLFAVAMMLEHLGEKKSAQRVRQAIIKTTAFGTKTFDLGGKASTTEVTDAVINNLKH
jgi:isopropylmalate/isohomocitrate dehydrogenase-like protein